MNGGLALHEASDHRILSYFLLERFAFESRETNKWFDFNHMRVYVRKGFHYIHGRVLSTLDIANVQVDEEYQNQGRFRWFLVGAEDTDLPIYVENILSIRFANFFRRRNYVMLPMYEQSIVSAFKPGKEIDWRKSLTKTDK